jgi:hypothetical protein
MRFAVGPQLTVNALISPYAYLGDPRLEYSGEILQDTADEVSVYFDVLDHGDPVYSDFILFTVPFGASGTFSGMQQTPLGGGGPWILTITPVAAPEPPGLALLGLGGLLLCTWRRFSLSPH